MSKTLLEFPLVEILPESIRNDAQAAAAAQAVQPDLDAVTDNIAAIELYARIDELPEPILHLLAWENRVAGVEWRLARTIREKRQLVRYSFELNRRRGTRWAVERVFELINLEATIVEWWEDGGDPFTFKIFVSDVGGRGIDFEEIELLNQLVSVYKPLTRHNNQIDIGLSPPVADVRIPAAITLIGVLEIGL